MFRWFMRDRAERLVSLQLQTLRKVNYLMANWNDLAAKILELKQETVKVLKTLDDVRAQLAAVLAADALDQAEVQKAHDAIAEVVADMDHKVHADGM